MTACKLSMTGFLKVSSILTCLKKLKNQVSLFFFFSKQFCFLFSGFQWIAFVLSYWGCGQQKFISSKVYPCSPHWYFYSYGFELFLHVYIMVLIVVVEECVCVCVCVCVVKCLPLAHWDFGYVGNRDFGALSSKENTVWSEECPPLTRPRLCKKTRKETNAVCLRRKLGD